MKTISQTMGTKSTRSGPTGERRRDQTCRKHVQQPASNSDQRKPHPERRDRRLSLHDDGDDHDRADREIERVPAGLSGHREGRGDRVRDDPRRDRSEEERLQSPHATLPSPPTTVSATAWAASGQPATARTGAVRTVPATTKPTPSKDTVRGPPAATAAPTARADPRMEHVRSPASADKGTRDTTEEHGMRRLVEPEPDARPDTDQDGNGRPGADERA